MTEIPINPEEMHEEGVFALPIRDEKTNKVEWWPMDETPGRPMSYIGETPFDSKEACEQWLRENYSGDKLLQAGSAHFEQAGISKE